MRAGLALSVAFRVAAGLAAGIVGAWVTTVVVETSVPNLIPYIPFIAAVILFGGIYKGVAAAKRRTAKSRPVP